MMMPLVLSVELTIICFARIYLEPTHVDAKRATPST